MLQEEKSAKLDSKGFMSAGKGRFVTAIAFTKTDTNLAKKTPQKLPQVWECKKGKGVRAFEVGVSSATDMYLVVKHVKQPAEFVTPAVWKGRARGGLPQRGRRRNALEYSSAPTRWREERDYPGTYYDEKLNPEEAARTWWFYKGVFYSTEEKLKPADVAALADEKENRKRLTLEKAHTLQAMRQQADGTKDWKPGREPIPQEVKLTVWQRDGGSCVECGSQKDLEFDHVIPLAMGGSNTERNLQLLCADCNRRKGATLG